MVGEIDAEQPSDLLAVVATEAGKALPLPLEFVSEHRKHVCFY